MKNHSTNYFDTFIEVAEDTKTSQGIIPSSKGEQKTVAEMQYELVAKNPYKYTSDEVFFEVFAKKKELTENELAAARELFFSKGQPCFRASPLTKSYGFGVHADSSGRVALVALESEAYQQFLENPKIKKLKAMRSSRK